VVLSLDDHIAERLAEQTCICALERDPLLTCSQRMDCWLFSILHSIWFHEYRDGNAKLNENNPVRPGKRHGGPHISDGTDLVSQVMELPDSYRATVFLAYVEGMSYREVAEVLALPINSVINALTGARTLLAERLSLAKESKPKELFLAQSRKSVSS